jgi:GT2 family glycosyltransferase
MDGERGSDSVVPVLSVVIPSHNRVDKLQQVLDGLARQDTCEPFEVVVVSDGSTDGTEAYLTSGSPPMPVVAICQSNAGPAAARNRGVDAARGDVVVFVDDDVVPTPGLLSAHLAVHRRLGRDAVVIGPMLEPPGYRSAPWVRWEHAMLVKQYEAMGAGRYGATARQFYTGNASVRREHLQAVGGFDPSFRRLEDVELAYRLDDHGLRWTFCPEAVGLHYAERSFEAWRGIAYEYGRNDVVFGRDHGRQSVLRTIAAEYPTRRLFVRALVRLAVPRPRLSTAIEQAVRRYATTSVGCRARRLTRAALSVVYNIAYYRGVADGLGGADQLRLLLRGRS